MPKALPNWQERYNAKFIMTFRVKIEDRPGTLADLLEVIGNAGGSMGNICIVDADSTHKPRVFAACTRPVHSTGDSSGEVVKVCTCDCFSKGLASRAPGNPRPGISIGWSGSLV